MKATETNLLDFLRKSPQFEIPIYQRSYSWTEGECRQLWEDILRTGRDEKIPAHFIGSIVYIEDSLYQVTGRNKLLVIDGQQRLATVSLIIEALARYVRDDEPIDGFSARKLRNRYLLDPDEDGEAGHKLLLTHTDKQTLLAIIGGKRLPDNPKEQSIRMKVNFEFFQNRVAELGDNLAPLCRGLAKLIIVDIALSRDQDNPQLIFESMNSTGRELSQADLIRNFALMGLSHQHQTRLYDDYWRPMEVAFGQDGYTRHFDSFMRHYLTVKTGEIPNIGKVYDRFKEYARSQETDIDSLLADLHKFAGYYCAMELGAEKNPSLAAAFGDLRNLKANVTYPFLLELYDRYAEGELLAAEFESAVRLVESYVFRRAVCDIPTNSMNRTFQSFAKALQGDRYIESIHAQFQRLPSYRRFPKNEEFMRRLKERDLYNFRNRSTYWLRRMENHDRKEFVQVGEYTIEHIMPQNEALSTEWRRMLGENWQQVQETWLHTLGNLTLTGYNTEYSDRPFREKRDMQGGFRESPLRVNQGLAEMDTWNEETIRGRAEKLAKIAVQVWPAPSPSKETLEAYDLNAPGKAANYSIQDHPFLVDGSAARDLFERLRQEIFALDPCVTEEFFKPYIAYKAETNFCDVAAQTRQLKLWLNMPFKELYDPQGLARDMTNIGHAGNGDVEITVNELEQLPYVMGLIRQSFENQMGEEIAN